MYQLKWLWKNLKGYHAIYILAIALSITCNLLQLAIPIFSQHIVDLFLGKDLSVNLANLETKRDLLIALVAGMIGSTMLRALLTYVSHMTYEYTSQKMIYSIRTHLFRKVLYQDMAFYDKYRTGDIMTRLTGDLEDIRHMASSIVRMVVESITMILIGMAYFLYLDPIVAFYLFLMAPIIFIVTRSFRKKMKQMHKELRETKAALNTAAQENISGNKVVKAFAREQYEMERFDEKNKAFRQKHIETTLVHVKYVPYIDTCANLLPVILLVAGGISLINGRITMGEYVAFNGMTWTISNPMKKLADIINQYQRFQASAKKVLEIYDMEPEICDAPDAIEHPEVFKGNITFDQVSFSYGNVEVLKDISFSVKAGETVAIMGETGSGKTTLINMLPRFYDPTKGRVLIDGMNVKDLKIRQLRKNIGMAMQDVLLFSDSVDGNISYGDSDMPEADVHTYAEYAAASEFIEKMPEQYKTIIGERGVGISGGQKQRISLARALAIKPSILILDDTTSAVDMETESYIQNKLSGLDFECTKFIIAQRISSTKDADKIIILDDGKIAEMGTHQELLANKGYYYQVYMLQNGGEASHG
ncbi:MAG: ABC transporter ATP-binding protein [Lachnospiraceae bacterium]|nr:ABC transporter ATP-binding protein [Lachnospiraceae bacterium]